MNSEILNDETIPIATIWPNQSNAINSRATHVLSVRGAASYSKFEKTTPIRLLSRECDRPYIQLSLNVEKVIVNCISSQSSPMQ